MKGDTANAAPQSEPATNGPASSASDTIPTETDPEGGDTPVSTSNTAQATSVEDDPFNAEMLDPYAQTEARELTAEEAADLAAELGQDPDAEKDDEGDKE
jgi:hypothetical protein